MTQQIDILFTNALVLTMDEKLNQYDPGAVAVKGDSIVAVGPQAEIKKGYSASEILDCGGKVLMPGLVNAHTHVPMTLLRGLADDRLAAALRQMHGHPGRAWTVEELAAEAALSRSAFFDRFKRVVGVAPMAYLLGWRMTLATDLLGRGGRTVAEVAERVGYGSASAFSVAFAREVGRPPVVFAREGPPPR